MLSKFSNSFPFNCYGRSPFFSFLTGSTVQKKRVQDLVGKLIYYWKSKSCTDSWPCTFHPPENVRGQWCAKDKIPQNMKILHEQILALVTQHYKVTEAGSR